MDSLLISSHQSALDACTMPWQDVHGVGKLNFLEKSTRPEISYSTHQVATFSEDPKWSHREVVIWLCKYLWETRDEGIILDLWTDKSLETYADADFAGNWNKSTVTHDLSMAKSRSGFVITFAGCPSLGPPNYKLKSLSVPQKPNT